MSNSITRARRPLPAYYRIGMLVVGVAILSMPLAIAAFTFAVGFTLEGGLLVLLTTIVIGGLGIAITGRAVPALDPLFARMGSDMHNRNLPRLSAAQHHQKYTRYYTEMRLIALLVAVASIMVAISTGVLGWYFDWNHVLMSVTGAGLLAAQMFGYALFAHLKLHRMIAGKGTKPTAGSTAQ